MLVTTSQAIALLNSGQVVAIPTETVYGLAAPINKPNALSSIFSIKKRPFFDPLIVHVSNIDQAKNSTALWPPEAEILAQKFWPGPLTLVLQKNNTICDLITSGLNTVGLRMPNHPLALEIINQCGPLAAPSANLFGHTSPTQADHVLLGLSNTLPVVDGGPCQIGIESTIVDLSIPKQIRILRPGLISQIQIEKAITQLPLAEQPHWAMAPKSGTESTDLAVSPGSLEYHYMPLKPLIVSTQNLSNEEIILKYKQFIVDNNSTKPSSHLIKLDNPKEVTTIDLPQTPQIAARLFYSLLHTASREPLSDLIYLKISPDQMSGDWLPLWDRIQKAATLSLI